MVLYHWLSIHIPIICTINFKYIIIYLNINNLYTKLKEDYFLYHIQYSYLNGSKNISGVPWESKYAYPIYTVSFIFLCFQLKWYSRDTIVIVLRDNYIGLLEQYLIFKKRVVSIGLFIKLEPSNFMILL